MYAWGAVAHTLFPLNIATIFLLFFLFFGVLPLTYFTLLLVPCARCVSMTPRKDTRLSWVLSWGCHMLRGGGEGMECQGVFSSEFGKRGKGEGRGEYPFCGCVELPLVCCS